MKHDIDLKRKHDSFEAAVQYLKAEGFMNIWGGAVLGGRGVLCASIGNNIHHEEVSFPSVDEEADREKIKKLVEVKHEQSEHGSAGGENDQGDQRQVHG